jgi:hypothetical protein
VDLALCDILEDLLPFLIKNFIVFINNKLPIFQVSYTFLKTAKTYGFISFLAAVLRKPDLNLIPCLDCSFLT